MTEKYGKKLVFSAFAALVLAGFITTSGVATATDDSNAPNTGQAAQDESSLIGFFKGLFEDEKPTGTEERSSPAPESVSVPADNNGPQTVDVQPPPFPVMEEKTAENAAAITPKKDAEKKQVDGTMSRLLNDVTRIN